MNFPAKYFHGLKFRAINHLHGVSRQGKHRWNKSGYDSVQVSNTFWLFNLPLWLTYSAVQKYRTIYVTVCILLENIFASHVEANFNILSSWYYLFFYSWWFLLIRKTFESIETSRDAIIVTRVSDHLEQVRGGKEFIKESQFYEKRLNQQNHQSYWTNIDVSKNDSCPEETIIFEIAKRLIRLIKKYSQSLLSLYKLNSS